MVFDTRALIGEQGCTCGKTHEMVTKRVVIEPGCMAELDAHCSAVGLGGIRCAIYDANTYEAKGLVRPKADFEIILAAENLHADEHGTGKVFEALGERRFDYFLAIGSGTVHDITRYCADKLKSDFVACPTAASVDGFCSTVSAMTWHGNKITLPGIAPVLVVADLNVITQAPLSLGLSGTGDILGKYTALADWKIANALTREYYCGRIEKLTRQAVEAARECCEALCSGNEDAFAQLTYALVLSGLAMQMLGNSRCASGAEHHISHFIEMAPPALGRQSHALHGEKVGVATTIVSRLYHKLAQHEDISAFATPFVPLDEAMIRKAFGADLVKDILLENKDDCLKAVTQEALKKAWPEVRRVIAEIPTAEELLALLSSMGAKCTLEEIEVDKKAAPLLPVLSPYIRNRLTLARILRILPGALE